MTHKTYKDIQREVSKYLGVAPASVRTCWIAEVKRAHGMTRYNAPNRGKGEGAPPCPRRYWAAIEKLISK